MTRRAKYKDSENWNKSICTKGSGGFTVIKTCWVLKDKHTGKLDTLECYYPSKIQAKFIAKPDEDLIPEKVRIIIGG